MSNESTSGDTSAEVERIRQQIAGGFASTPQERALLAALDRVTKERDALAVLPLGTAAPSRADAERMRTLRALIGGGVVPTNGEARFILAALDRVTKERNALAARLPSPESVTRARLVAAEIVDVAITETNATPLGYLAGGESDVATACAAAIRDRARTHSGTHDEGGDVDERELLWCASRVDGCTTLGELEALVARWREVA